MENKKSAAYVYAEFRLSFLNSKRSSPFRSIRKNYPGLDAIYGAGGDNKARDNSLRRLSVAQLFRVSHMIPFDS